MEELIGDAVYKARIYPNPAGSSINIESNTLFNNAAWKLIDMTGKTIMEGTIPHQSDFYHIDLPHIASGVYQFMIKDTEGQYIHKLIKE